MSAVSLLPMPIDVEIQLTRDELEMVAVAAAAVAALSFLLALLALARVRGLRRRLRRPASKRPDAPTAAAGADAEDASALRHIGVVRYDAFADMGGRMSFSAAIYNDNGDGLVLSSINGRSETRTYAKELTGLTSEHRISPEEQAAIDAARTG